MSNFKQFHRISGKSYVDQKEVRGAGSLKLWPAHTALEKGMSKDSLDCTFGWMHCGNCWTCLRGGLCLDIRAQEWSSTAIELGEKGYLG